MIKQLNKKYFNEHPLKEISTARFEYSMYTMPDIDEYMENYSKENGLITPESQEELAAIDAAVKPEELLLFMKKGSIGLNRNKLRKKLLEREAEMKPLIQKRAMTILQDIFIENTVNFFLRCEENCCSWILEHYKDMRSEYLKSMLCLVIAFRGDETMVPFLMAEVERFKRDYPEMDYDQGPLLALYEIKERFS